MLLHYQIPDSQFWKSRTTTNTNDKRTRPNMLVFVLFVDVTCLRTAKNTTTVKQIALDQDRDRDQEASSLSCHVVVPPRYYHESAGSSVNAATAASANFVFNVVGSVSRVLRAPVFFLSLLLLDLRCWVAKCSGVPAPSSSSSKPGREAASAAATAAVVAVPWLPAANPYNNDIININNNRT